MQKYLIVAGAVIFLIASGAAAQNYISGEGGTYFADPQGTTAWNAETGCYPRYYYDACKCKMMMDRGPCHRWCEKRCTEVKCKTACASPCKTECPKVQCFSPCKTECPKVTCAQPCKTECPKVQCFQPCKTECPKPTCTMYRSSCNTCNNNWGYSGCSTCNGYWGSSTYYNYSSY